MNGQKKSNQVKEWLRWSKELQIPWIHKTEQMPICQAARHRNIYTGVRNLADLSKILANNLKIKDFYFTIKNSSIALKCALLYHNAH